MKTTKLSSRDSAPANGTRAEVHLSGLSTDAQVPPDSETLVEFQGVSKQYRLGLSRESLPSLVARKVRRLMSPLAPGNNSTNLFWALRDVSFELKRGQCLALVGANGAGKTTILKLLSRITRPSQGHIGVHGKLSALIELGAGFHPDLTGRENIYLNGTILGLSRKYVHERFEEIVEFAGIGEFIDTPLKRYSSGMAVRLGFAVASCVEPDILLIDEVLAVGDASFRQRCLKRIESMIADGTAIIFVSHDLFMVKAICESAVYLSHGTVKARGETKAIIDEYERDVHLLQTSERKATDTAPPVNEHGLDITRVEVVPADGSDALRSEEPAEIRIEYRAWRDQGDVHAAVFVNRADGLICCTMRTSLDGKPIHLRRGTGIVRVYLDRLLLGSGMYSAETAFLNQSDSVQLTPDGRQSEWFYVNGRGISCAENTGVYEPVAEWKHEVL